MTLENFAHKTCYDYVEAYDVTLICTLFIKILYSSCMHYNKKTYRNFFLKITQKKCQNLL